MKFSQFFCPTLKEKPVEAEVVSHQLMLRSGMIRQLSAGIFDVLPLGLRVLRKVENIIRSEMNATGAQEVFLPAIHPAELWMETKRWEHNGKELLRIKDRKGRDYCFAPTHEEAITDLVRREIKSYRQLPVTLYQIQTKFRDEVRPRFGVMRCREFTMKDAYSFDATDAGADASYKKMFHAYENIFRRCGLKFLAVAADSGNIGGSLSEEFMVLAKTGENEVIVCPSCGYSANIEKGQCHVARPTKTASIQTLEKVETKNQKECKAVAAHLKVDLKTVLKTCVFEVDEKHVAVVLPGNREVNEIALTRFLNAKYVKLADEKTVQSIFGAAPGSIGPVGLDSKKLEKIIYDAFVFEGESVVVGANEDDHHFIHAQAGRDFKIETQFLLSKVMAGDLCVNCQTPLGIERGIEVGHVFKLGTKYSEAMNAVFVDEKGETRPMIMGCFGVGVARTAAAAIEQNHDEQGMIFPPPIAPFEVVIIATESRPGEVKSASDQWYETLKTKFDVLYDDRDETAGAKFKDSELLGIPVRITIGKKSLAQGVVEVKARWKKESETLAPNDLQAWIEKTLKSFPN